ncbi:MAG: PDZ domain-containing protein, partial [Octadecabacter sp.]|nr:PDZ domain-containing protein [Octadecabacter sp.]
QLKEFGETRRGWLGVRIQNVTADMVDAIDGLEAAMGAMVTDVSPGPALDAGLESGDVILMFDGVEIDDTNELVNTVGNSPVGKQVPVLVLRNGDMVDLTVTLGRRETAEAAAFPADEGEVEGPATTNMLGLTLSEISPEIAEELGVPAASGLVVLEVDVDSEAASKGLLAGDIITEAGQRKIASIAEFETTVEAAQEAGRKSLLLLVRRDGSPRFVALGIE